MKLRDRHPFFDTPAPSILGHRGAAGEAPENTLYGFETALASGAHILETDLHATRDGVPVLIHDARVDRTTDGTGPIADLTWSEVRELDAAYRFRPGRADGQDATDARVPDDSEDAPLRGRGHRIPSLEEALEAFPKARFNLELKHPDPDFARAVVALVRAHEREALTLLTAGEDEIIRTLRIALREANSRVALGASLADILDYVKSGVAGGSPQSDSMALQVPAAFAGRPLVTRELIAHAHRFGTAIHVWTIDDADEMRRLIDLGVDGLVTDYPGRMAELLRAP